MQTRLFVYKHVNVLEHLRGNALTHTEREQGRWDWWLITLVDWMTIHDSALRCSASVCLSYVCLAGCVSEATGGFLRWQSRSIRVAAGEQGSRAALAAAPPGALPRQRDWAGVMIAIRQLYEYLWQTSAVKTLHDATQSWACSQTGCGAGSQTNRSWTADVGQASGGLKVTGEEVSGTSR